MGRTGTCAPWAAVPLRPGLPAPRRSSLLPVLRRGRRSNNPPSRSRPTMSECTRREFSACVAASVSATLVTVGVVADDMDPKRDSKEKPPEEAAVTPPSPSREDHLLAALLDRYPGSHLTPEMVEGIRS